MEWISVKDRLPKEDELVLIYFKRNLTPCFGMLSKERRFFGYRNNPKWVDKSLFLLNDKLITHWMPLPEPPNNQTL